MSSRTVKEIVAAYGGRPRCLVEILEDLQEERGYLSEEDMQEVSSELQVPVIEVYRVANFYKAFSLSPRGRHVITVCMGTACHVRGAPRLLDQLRGQLNIEPGQTTEDGLFTLESVNCLGACALGPVAVLDGDYRGGMTPDKLRKLVLKLQQADREVPVDA
jgi:NADH:ubiquinone oxidoreductase subunit E